MIFWRVHFQAARLKAARSESVYSEDALRFSAELLELAPEEPTLLGTRGSVLIEIGALEAGSAMLQKIINDEMNPLDRVFTTAYLGYAEIQRGNLPAAAAWLEKARAINPTFPPLFRFEAELKKRQPG